MHKHHLRLIRLEKAHGGRDESGPCMAVCFRHVDADPREWINAVLGGIGTACPDAIFVTDEGYGGGEPVVLTAPGRMSTMPNDMFDRVSMVAGSDHSLLMIGEDGSTAAWRNRDGLQSFCTAAQKELAGD